MESRRTVGLDCLVGLVTHRDQQRRTEIEGSKGPRRRARQVEAVAGSDAAVGQFLPWAQAEADKPEVRGVKVESMGSGRPEMRQTLDRASQFLNLVALLAALLCAVAVALAARSFAERQLDACALLRVLGQSQRTLTLSYGLEFLGAGLAA